MISRSVVLSEQVLGRCIGILIDFENHAISPSDAVRAIASIVLSEQSDFEHELQEGGRSRSVQEVAP